MKVHGNNKYSLDQWALAQELVVSRPDITIVNIAEEVGIAFDALYTHAKRKGWLALRELSDVRKAGSKLHQIIREIAGQTTDVHEHTIAMVEALQNSFKILIIRDNEGHIHYQNMPPLWPSKPTNFDRLSPEDKERELLTIDSARLQNFISNLVGILKVKMDNVQFIAKMIKGSLPKIDPDTVDVSRRIGDSTIDILATTDSRSLEEALSTTLKQLEGNSK